MIDLLFSTDPSPLLSFFNVLYFLLLLFVVVEVDDADPDADIDADVDIDINDVVSGC